MCEWFNRFDQILEELLLKTYDVKNFYIDVKKVHKPKFC